MPKSAFGHKADLPRCLLFVRSRGQSGQADLTAFFLIAARTNEKPRPCVTADVVSGKPATKGSASTSRHGHTCEVPPTRKEVNASPRAQSCSHRSDLPSARSPTLERQKGNRQNENPARAEELGGFIPHAVGTKIFNETARCGSKMVRFLR